MKCPNCGQEVQGNFCQNCGTRITQLPPQAQHQKNKKKGHGCLTAIIVVFVVFAILAAVGSNTESDDSTTQPTATVQPTETPSPTATPVPTTEPTPDASSDSSSSDSDSESSVSLDLLAAAMNLTLQDSFENSDFSYDDTSITMTVWQDNIAAGALLAQQGNAELQESWNEMRDNLINMCQSARDMLDEAGYTDVTVTLNLLNDMNQDNTLLSVMDGVVIYDAVNDQ